MPNWLPLVATCLLLLTGQASCLADTPKTNSPLQLSSLFQAGAVLQREQIVPVSGSAVPNAEVVVKFQQLKLSTRADEQGHWQLDLPPHSAGGPYQMVVESQGNSKVLEDLYFGEVWLASGQSNMEWKLLANVDNMAAEIQDSDYPQIRFFEVPDDYSIFPQRELIKEAKWQVASPSSSANFSAVAWFFAKQLHQEKGVPVGIIDSTWGGTPAQTWTPANALLKLPAYHAKAQTMIRQPMYWQNKLNANKAKESRKKSILENQKQALGQGVHLADYDDSQWQLIDLPVQQEPLQDVVWLRKRFTLETGSEQALLSLGMLIQESHLYLNGELIFHKVWESMMDPVTLPAKLLKEGENTIAIRVINGWDNKVFLGEEGKVWLQVEGEQREFADDWRFSNTIDPAIPDVEFIHWNPTLLYNAMIRPLINFPIKGVIWYQGESNAGEAEHYRELFGAMIQSWRAAWKQPEMPFIFTQLANFMERKALPERSDWAELREAQRRTLELPATGMAVTIDIGDALDIHPRNKQDVGYRLWLAAKHIAYGEEGVYSGPLPLMAQATSEGVKISFDQTAQGLVAHGGEPLVGFAVSEDGNNWLWSMAQIQGEQVIVNKPAALNKINWVRYAWADNPDCNLTNSLGLPATPFELKVD